MTAAPRITIAFNTSAKPAGSTPAFAAPAANDKEENNWSKNVADATDDRRHAQTLRMIMNETMPEGSGINGLALTGIALIFAQTLITKEKRKKDLEKSFQLYLLNQKLRDMTRGLFLTGTSILRHGVEVIDGRIEKNKTKINDLDTFLESLTNGKFDALSFDKKVEKLEKYGINPADVTDPNGEINSNKVKEEIKKRQDVLEEENAKLNEEKAQLEEDLKIIEAAMDVIDSTDPADQELVREAIEIMIERKLLAPLPKGIDPNDTQAIARHIAANQNAADDLLKRLDDAAKAEGGILESPVLFDLLDLFDGARKETKGLLNENAKDGLLLEVQKQIESIVADSNLMKHEKTTEINKLYTEIKNDEKYDKAEFDAFRKLLTEKYGEYIPDTTAPSSNGFSPS